MSDLVRILDKGERAKLTLSGKQYEILITYIQPLALEKAAQSGLFGPTETTNLLHLSRKVRVYNVEVQFFISSVNGTNEIALGFAAKNLESTRLALIRDINLLSKQLAIPLIELPSE